MLDVKVLFFIGDEFYRKSGTMMSSIYEEGTFARFDWGFVGHALREGETVIIRPANSREMEWAIRSLEASTHLGIVVPK